MPSQIKALGRIRLISLIFIFGCSIATAQEKRLPLSTWGKFNIPRNQSAHQVFENILGSSPRWVTASSLLSDDKEWRAFIDPVSRIDIKYSDSWAMCTGFFISKAYILTNAHCVKNKGKFPNEVVLRLNYLDENDPTAWESVPLKTRPKEMDESLDYAIFEVIRPPKKNYGILSIKPMDIPPGRPIMIVQHPEGSPKKVALKGCASATPNAIVENSLLHLCDTLSGSSGSPVIDREDGKVIALHYAGSADVTFGKNFARPISLIAKKSSIIQDIIDNDAPDLLDDPSLNDDTDSEDPVEPQPIIIRPTDSTKYIWRSTEYNINSVQPSPTVNEICEQGIPATAAQDGIDMKAVPWFKATCKYYFSTNDSRALNDLKRAMGELTNYSNNPTPLVSVRWYLTPRLQCLFKAVEAVETLKQRNTLGTRADLIASLTLSYSKNPKVYALHEQSESCDLVGPAFAFANIDQFVRAGGQAQNISNIFN